MAMDDRPMRRYERGTVMSQGRELRAENANIHTVKTRHGETLHIDDRVRYEYGVGGKPFTDGCVIGFPAKNMVTIKTGNGALLRVYAEYVVLLGRAKDEEPPVCRHCDGPLDTESDTYYGTCADCGAMRQSQIEDDEARVSYYRNKYGEDP